MINDIKHQDCDQRAKSIGDMAGSARSKQILAISEEFQVEDYKKR